MPNRTLGTRTNRLANARNTAITARSKPSRRPSSGCRSNWQREPRIDSIILVAANDNFNNIGAGFGFPPRFKVEVSNDPDFKTEVTTITDQTAADYKNPRC